jgi:hypothetical protein
VLESGEEQFYPRAHSVLDSLLADRIRKQLAQWEALGLIK